MTSLPEQAPPTLSIAPDRHSPQPAFNWRTCWYPITFLADLPSDRPYGFSIYGENFVLFRDDTGQLVCLADLCPHRAAKLSDGQVIDGKLECLYHGWQFGAAGACLHIPQLPTEAQMPHRACATAFPVVEQQGLIWVWADRPETMDRDRLPQIEELADPDLFVVDTVTDLPFDHTFLLENLLDPAHVYISHDRTELNILREDAQPLEMEILSSSEQGFRGRFRGARRANAPWVAIHFQAPALVHYSFTNAAFGVVGGLGLYALPIAYGQSRILVRRYSNRFKRTFTLKPRWLEHLRQNKILEQDLAFIVAQQQHFERSGQSVQQVYFPLKSCDLFVMEHRRWLDQVGATLPWYQGYLTAKVPKQPVPLTTTLEIPNRFQRHTQHCGACRPAYQRLQWLQQASAIAAIGWLAMAILTENGWQWGSLVGFFTMAIGWGLLANLKRHFEQSYQRHS